MGKIKYSVSPLLLDPATRFHYGFDKSASRTCHLVPIIHSIVGTGISNTEC